MKQSQVIIMVSALVNGFGSGFALRPVLMPAQPPAARAAPAASPAGADQPSEAEATAAVRRYRTGFNIYSQATLTLGECSQGTPAPGVTCMTRIVLRPGAPPQSRPIGFARVGGQWEVSVW